LRQVSGDRLDAHGSDLCGAGAQGKAGRSETRP
jgi:hypothetical protein